MVSKVLVHNKPTIQSVSRNPHQFHQILYYELFLIYVFYFLGPNQIENITPITDSNNITLEYPRPEGRIENYVISWWPTEDPSQIQRKNISEQSLMNMYSTGSGAITDRLFANSHSGK